MARKCCCGGGLTCQGFCPDGPPAQWQATIPDTVFSAEGTPDFTCEEEQCDERTGVVLLDLVAPEDIATEWFLGPPPEDACLWIGPEFETCQFYFFNDFTMELELVTWTLRWQLQGNKLYLVHVTGPGTFGTEWEELETNLGDYECGDPMTFTDSGGPGLGFGCTYNPAIPIVVELPP